MESLLHAIEECDPQLLCELEHENRIVDPVYGKTYMCMELVCTISGLFDQDYGLDKTMFYELFNMTDDDLDTLKITDSDALNRYLSFAVQVVKNNFPETFHRRVYDVIERLFKFGADPNYKDVRPIVFDTINSTDSHFFELFIRRGAKRSSTTSVVRHVLEDVSVQDGVITVENVKIIQKIFTNDLFSHVVGMASKEAVNIMLYDTIDNPIIFINNTLAYVYKRFGIHTARHVLYKGLDVKILDREGKNVTRSIDDLEFLEIVLDHDPKIVDVDDKDDYSILLYKIMQLSTGAITSIDIPILLIERGFRFRKQENIQELNIIREERFSKIFDTLKLYNAMPVDA